VQDFSAQLHNRGMRYIQDITLNESNPPDNHVFALVYNGDGSVFVQNYQDDFELAHVRNKLRLFENQNPRF
jgi:hypothetical protein